MSAVVSHPPLLGQGEQSNEGFVEVAKRTDRARRACDALDAMAPELIVATRRAMPWLRRKRIEIRATAAKSALLPEVVQAARAPAQVTSVLVKKSYRGALVVDGPAIARAVDGVLADGTGDLPVLDPKGLSAAQRALAGRLAADLVGAMGESLGRAGFELEAVRDDGASESGGLCAAVTLEIGTDESVGRLTIVIPVAALTTAAPSDGPSANEMSALLGDVELEIIATLGRVPLSLRQLAALRVGDTIRLPLATSAAASIAAGGRRLFEGQPTTSGAQIALTITKTDS
jgi:flagellar motor switch protein FliM